MFPRDLLQSKHSRALQRPWTKGSQVNVGSAGLWQQQGLGMIPMHHVPLPPRAAEDALPSWRRAQQQHSTCTAMPTANGLAGRKASPLGYTAFPPGHPHCHFQNAALAMHNQVSPFYQGGIGIPESPLHSERTPADLSDISSVAMGLNPLGMCTMAAFCLRNWSPYYFPWVLVESNHRVPAGSAATA